MAMSPHTAIIPSLLCHTKFKHICSTLFVLLLFYRSRSLIDTHWSTCRKHELLILCSNFHSLIDMFNACNSSETDYCPATTAQCTISRPVPLIGELCDWTVIMECLQMQCNWQPIICLFISLWVCISNIFICLQSILCVQIWWRRQWRWCCWNDRWLAFSDYIGRSTVLLQPWANDPTMSLSIFRAFVSMNHTHIIAINSTYSVIDSFCYCTPILLSFAYFNLSRRFGFIWRSITHLSI